MKFGETYYNNYYYNKICSCSLKPQVVSTCNHAYFPHHVDNKEVIHESGMIFSSNSNTLYEVIEKGI